MSIEALLLAKRNNYSILVPACNTFDVENPKCAHLMFIFYISKILDFVDTFAIVMRGKGRQLSVLHVYHHSSIFLFYWLNLKILYDGDIFFTILLNAFIHAVMYTYYFITLQIPKTDGKPVFQLWWKKHTTQLQMLQFTMMVSQAVYSHFITCPTYSKRHNFAYLVYIVSLFALFSNFYKKSYSKKEKDKKSKNNKDKKS
jgi:elongation of very long chain fatty acids protein 4